MPLTNCWICGGKRLVPVHQGLFELEAYAEQDPELAEYTGERFWLNLQTTYELELERDRLKDRLTKEVQTLKHAS